MLNRRLLTLALSQRSLFLLTITFACASAVTIIAQAWIVSVAVAGVLLHGQTLAMVLPSLGVLSITILFRALLQSAHDFTASALAIQLKRDLRGALVRHLLALGPAFARGERTGELTTIAVEGIEALDAYFSQYLPQIVIAAIVPLAILLVILPLDLVTALILLITAPLIPLFMVLIGNAAGGLTRRRFHRLGALSAHFLDVLQGLTTLKLLNASRGMTESIRRAGDEYARATLSVLRVAFLSAFVLELLATISVAIVAVAIGLRVLYDQMGFQAALFILILAPEFYIPLRMLGLRFHAAASGTAAAARIMEILDTPLPARGAPLRVLPAPPKRLVLQNVSFSYPDARAALNNVSFELDAGTTTALFGPSGAGKTTIVNLLLGFDQPARGEILIDRVPLRELDADAWRACVAYVPQAPHLFHDTIVNNIRLARPDAREDEIVRAAQDARLHDWIMTLPRAYETVIGENGARLSGGQAQRLALARAFLKDAPFLVLDEPTSNVDPALEAQLRDATARLMRGRTTLLIAHRLATLYRADRILVLENGRLVESGTHDALLLRRGTYNRLAYAGAGYV